MTSLRTAIAGLVLVLTQAASPALAGMAGKYSDFTAYHDDLTKLITQSSLPDVTKQGFLAEMAAAKAKAADIYTTLKPPEGYEQLDQAKDVLREIKAKAIAAGMPDPNAKKKDDAGFGFN